MTRLKAFALDTDPLTKQLLPVAADLGPTLLSVQRLSPDLRRLFVNLGPLITVSKTGLPGIRDVLLGAKPLLGVAGAVPGRAQPDPPLALAAPAAGLRLHLQRRRRPGRQDGVGRRRRHRALPAPVLPGRARDALVLAHPRCRQPRQHLPAAAVAGRSERPQAEQLALLGLQATPAGRSRRSRCPAPLGRAACWVAPPLPGAAAGPDPAHHRGALLEQVALGAAARPAGRGRWYWRVERRRSRRLRRRRCARRRSPTRRRARPACARRARDRRSSSARCGRAGARTPPPRPPGRR